ncbi:ribonuclease H-like domain-containing protein [Tanacetum coccineum]
MNGHVTTTSPLPRSHKHALSDSNWQKAMHKFNTHGSLSMYKARIIANRCSQQQGIDCDGTFSPVVKPATIHTVLSLADPYDTESKLGSDGDPVSDPTLYRNLAGAV